MKTSPNLRPTRRQRPASEIGYGLAYENDREKKHEKERRRRNNERRDDAIAFRRRRMHRRREKELRQEKCLMIATVIIGGLIFVLIPLSYFFWTEEKQHKEHSLNPQEIEESDNARKRRYKQRDKKLMQVDQAILHDKISESDILLNPKLLLPLTKNDGSDHPLISRSEPLQVQTEDQHWKKFFQVTRIFDVMPWQQGSHKHMNSKPFLDYTETLLYTYPDHHNDIPSENYPQLRTLNDILMNWPQDEIDDPPSTIHEVLMHFDYNNAQDMELAWDYQNQNLPFKLVNVPEILFANDKWTDSYLEQQFDHLKNTKGHAQESPTDFFPFYDKRLWNVDTLGVPPTRSNDFTFKQWARHARYADAVQLPSHRPHFYWQSGTTSEEDDTTFIRQDLPSFSSTSANIFCPDPSKSKGIQCRFGERGITAANHYDGGQNMVAMISGAKRYILSPPNQCSKLGIVTQNQTPLYRHSLLNFGRYNLSNDAESKMSTIEREWLQIAGTSMALETVLKQGEVLFIPSHWFHYIIGLQKNAQCNVRSGVQVEGNPLFGGQNQVKAEECQHPKTK